jgi:hypothetical protein
MRALADAVVYAVTYINLSEDEREELLDDDVGALESIAGLVQEATVEELDALAAAADRALAAELRRPRPREQFVSEYRSFMADLIGEPWEGNRRVG